MFRCVTLAGLIGVGMYTGMKAAYLSTVFATRVEERNLIYIAPLLLIGTAIVLERRRVNWYALAAATAYAFYLVVGTPFQMGVQLYSDALGLSILQQANRYLYWTPTIGQWVLLARARRRGRRGRCAARCCADARGSPASIAAVLAVGIVGWNLTGEIGAAAGTNSISRDAAATLRHPFTWVDDITQAAADDLSRRGRGRPEPGVDARVLEPLDRRRQQLRRHRRRPRAGRRAEPHGERVALLDAPTPRIPDGSTPTPSRTIPASTSPARSAAGTTTAPAAATKVWHLVKLTHPNRLRAVCIGIYPDGWSGAADSAYYRFSDGKNGWLRVVVSRRDWGGPTGPSPVHILSRRS